MATEHTPGPWWAAEPEPRTGRIVIVSQPGAMGVAHCFTKSDADLIASAPELLASLNEIVQEWGCPNTPKWHRARAAIAKAEGRAP